MLGKEFILTQIQLMKVGEIIETIDVEAFLKDTTLAEDAIAQMPEELRADALKSLLVVKKFAESFREVLKTFGPLKEQIGPLPGKRQATPHQRASGGILLVKDRQ